MSRAENDRDATLASVELNDEGFFIHPEQWTEAMVPALAARIGIRGLSDRHWQVIRFTRNQFLERRVWALRCASWARPREFPSGNSTGCFPGALVRGSPRRRHAQAVPLSQQRLVAVGAGGRSAGRDALRFRASGAKPCRGPHPSRSTPSATSPGSSDTRSPTSRSCGRSGRYCRPAEASKLELAADGSPHHWASRSVSIHRNRCACWPGSVASMPSTALLSDSLPRRILRRGPHGDHDLLCR
jgi:hypothetical protein